mgnify:CR=1 FL=1|tara:strand:- start:826 stop:969 length:144 start_codon:yes stop_codon:yes gene_type:complete
MQAEGGDFVKSLIKKLLWELEEFEQAIETIEQKLVELFVALTEEEEE